MCHLIKNNTIHNNSKIKRYEESTWHVPGLYLFSLRYITYRYRYRYKVLPVHEVQVQVQQNQYLGTGTGTGTSTWPQPCYKVTDGPNRNQFGPNNSNLLSHLTLFSHSINVLYHNVSLCHFLDRIHVSIIIYSQIYFWSGDGLPGPPFCDGSHLDSYTVMLCSPVGRLPRSGHCVCLIGNEVEGSDWKKMCVVALRPWNSQHLVWLVQSCSRDQAGNQNVRQMFSTAEKSTIFANFPASVGTSQNGHTPKRPQPERPHWVGSLPERPHYFGQNGHTALVKTAT